MQVLTNLANSFANQLYIFLSSVWIKFKYASILVRTTIPHIPVWLQWLIVGTFITTGLWLVWQGMMRKSKLLEPEVLDLTANNPAHLSGRENDLQALIAAVILNPLVFLEGEAGVGKSALIQAGLIPTLRQTDITSHITPIYINCYGDNWDQDLHARLSIAIWYALTAIEQQKLGIKNLESWQQQLIETDHDTRSLLNWLHEQLDQHLLLIFDQFDDYLVTYHQHFLRNGRWITANELVAQNAFWCGVYGALEHSNLHCLFVTRRRWTMGLEAVRFRQPVQRALDLVEADAIASLLSHLVTVPPVDQNLNQQSPLPIISNPHISWTALKELLIQDLTNKNRILPIQARIAFKGLKLLPELSIEAYEAIGRLEGMEAAYIQNAILNAAKSAGTSDTQVQHALMALVDETIPLLPRATHANQTIIFAAAQVDIHRGTRLLTALEQSGVIRRGLNFNFNLNKDSSANSGCNWTLYHDYLARLVLVIQRRAERWQRLLQARQCTFYTVNGVRAKWRALLNPKELFGLLRETLFGRVNWEGHKYFCILSTLRTLPFIAALVLILIATNYGLDWQARNKAELILSKLEEAHEISSPITGDTLRQLWALAAANDRLKQAFVKRSLMKLSAHPVLIERIAMVTQAIFGLDPKFIQRKFALNLILTPSSHTKTLNHQILPYSAILATAIYATNPQTFKKLAGTIALNIESATHTCHEVSALIALGQALNTLRQDIPAKSISTVTTYLVENLFANNDGWQIVHLGQVLNSFGELLPQPQVQLSTERLVAVMRFTTNRNLLISLGKTLSDFGPRLPTTQAVIAANYLINALGTSTDPEKMSSLTTVLLSMAKNMPPQQKQKVAIELVEVMQASKDREQLNNLSETLKLLAPQLPEPQIVISTLATYLSISHDPDQRAVLSQSILRFGQFLTLPQLQATANQLFEVMKNTPNPDQLAELGNNLGILIMAAKDSITKDLHSSIQAATERLVALMTTSTVPRHLAELGTALAAFGSQLSPNQAQTAAARLVEAMRVSTAPGHLVTLGRALASLQQQLPPATAQAGAERLVEILETGTDPEQLSPIGEVLDLLKTRLEKAPVIIERLLVLLNSNQDQDRLTNLGLILEKLTSTLTTNQAPTAISHILELIPAATNPDTLAVLAQLLGQLFDLSTTTDPKILIQQTQTIATQLVTVMQSSTDWNDLVALANALNRVIQKQNPIDSNLLATTQIGIERLVEAIRANTVPSQLAALSQGLNELVQTLAYHITQQNSIESTATAPVQIAAERLIAAMRTNTEAEQLAQLAQVLNTITKNLTPAQIQTVGTSLIAAMQATSDEEQIFQLGQVWIALATRLTPAQLQAGANRLVEILQAVTEHTRLIELLTIVNSLRQHLSPLPNSPGNRELNGELSSTFQFDNKVLTPNLAQAVAEIIINAMRTNSDGEQLVELSQALINLVNSSSPTTQLSLAELIQTAVLRLIEVLTTETTIPMPQELLAQNLNNLSKQISKSQLEPIAQNLVATMQKSSDWRKLIILSNIFNQLGTLLPATSIQTAAAQVVQTMQHTTSPDAFIQMANLLPAFQITSDLTQIPQTVALLASPLAVGTTKAQILALISRLAGNRFETTDAFVAWNNANLMLDLAQPPLSPFQ